MKSRNTVSTGALILEFHIIKMAYLYFILIVVTLGVPTMSQTCHTSLSCPKGSCCQDEHGNVLSSEQMFGHFGGGFTQSTGNCTRHVAQKGEPCDSHCQCGTGLECYRPMSGVCCPPMRCYDAAYVHQQKEYWAKCISNPNCALPP